MKLIVAIQPDKLDEVHQALINAGASASRCQQEDQELYRGEEVTPSLISKVKLEIAGQRGVRGAHDRRHHVREARRRGHR